MSEEEEVEYELSITVKTDLHVGWLMDVLRDIVTEVENHDRFEVTATHLQKWVSAPIQPINVPQLRPIKEE